VITQVWHVEFLYFVFQRVDADYLQNLIIPCDTDYCSTTFILWKILYPKSLQFTEKYCWQKDR